MASCTVRRNPEVGPESLPAGEGLDPAPPPQPQQVPIVAAGDPPGALAIWARSRPDASDGSRPVEYIGRSIPPEKPGLRRGVP